MVDLDIVASRREQARTFMARAWEYLEAGDLHQASEKGWGAAAHIAKAVAEAQGWPYRNHEQFLQVVNGTANLLQRRLRPWRKSATDLHSFYYWRKEAMDAEDIRENLADVEALIGVLEGLAMRSVRAGYMQVAAIARAMLRPTLATRRLRPTQSQQQPRWQRCPAFHA